MKLCAREVKKLNKKYLVSIIFFPIKAILKTTCYYYKSSILILFHFISQAYKIGALWHFGSVTVGNLL